jgi:hypothetical protein
MILPDFVIPSRVNQHWLHSGIDSPELCLDKKHFESYAYSVEYNYNSRGYRDQEWPVSIDELKHGIWCLGDSFTVGLGSPLEHTWPYVLQQATNTRTINVSMDGASNNWMARKAIRVLQEISPKIIIIQWSYIARRESSLEESLNRQWDLFYQNIRDDSWSDCARDQQHNLPTYILQEIDTLHGGWEEKKFLHDEWRIMQSICCSDEDDIANTLTCIQNVQDCAGNTVVIHSFIPNFVPYKYKGVIEAQTPGLVIPEISRLDLARDGHHYDVATAGCLVDHIQRLL